MSYTRHSETTANRSTFKDRAFAHCPLSNLPGELHSAILLIAQAIEREEMAIEHEEREELEATDDQEITGLSSLFEIRVSHVSKYWRAVALGTGQLWTRIVVQPGYSPEGIETYLARSKHCLLDIELLECPSTMDTKNTLDLLFQNSDRWKTCLIEAGMDSFTMAGIVPLAALSLEALQFSVKPPDRVRRSDERWQSRFVLKGGCPRLKVANLHGFAVHYARPPLSSVTHLELDYRGRLPLDYNEFRELLTSSPALEDLSVNGEITDAMSHNDRSYVLLPNLLRLCISSLQGRVYSGILLTVKAPLLRSLILEGAQDSDLDPFLEAPHDLVYLRSFSVRESALSPAKLSKFYASFPSLQKMAMPNFTFNPSEVLRVMSEAMCDLGLVPIKSTPSSINQKPSTLASVLDPDQRSALRELLEEKLINENIVDLDNSGWSFMKFFDWLQFFATAEVLR